MVDLDARWDRDVIAERPDVVSVKIGINDVWRRLYDKPTGVPPDRYAEAYRGLLGRTRDALPDCRLVLCEPSVFLPPEPARGNDLLADYVAAVADLAREFGAAAVVPLHRAFLDAHAARPEVALTGDGVHMTPAGDALIARTWLASTGLL